MLKRDERSGGSSIKAEGVNVKVKQLLYINAFLPKLLKLASLGFANGTNPIGRQILECRIGRNTTFYVAKLRVIDPLTNLTTILLHLFHVVLFLVLCHTERSEGSGINDKHRYLASFSMKYGISNVPLRIQRARLILSPLPRGSGRMPRGIVSLLHPSAFGTSPKTVEE